jgi:hypothetical protein
MVRGCQNLNSDVKTHRRGHSRANPKEVNRDLALDLDAIRTFASLVLEGAYEATMLGAALNWRGSSYVVFLTSLSSGAFGDDESRIQAAIRRALQIMSGFDLDVKLVSYGVPSRALLQICAGF